MGTAPATFRVRAAEYSSPARNLPPATAACLAGLDTSTRLSLRLTVMITTVSPNNAERFRPGFSGHPPHAADGGEPLFVAEQLAKQARVDTPCTATACGRQPLC